MNDSHGMFIIFIVLPVAMFHEYRLCGFSIVQIADQTQDTETHGRIGQSHMSASEGADDVEVGEGFEEKLWYYV
jgi:hypothetical protein